MGAQTFVYEAGVVAPRSHEWGKGYVTHSGETLGYATDREGVAVFLDQFLASESRVESEGQR